MLRIGRTELEKILDYWRVRCESCTDDVVPIYISSMNGKEKKECHITFSDDGKSLLIVEDDPDQTHFVLKDEYLHHEIKITHDMKPLIGRDDGIVFSEHRSFGEGDETLTTPHREHLMNRFTKEE